MNVSRFANAGMSALLSGALLFSPQWSLAFGPRTGEAQTTVTSTQALSVPALTFRHYATSPFVSTLVIRYVDTLVLLNPILTKLHNELSMTTASLWLSSVALVVGGIFSVPEGSPTIDDAESLMQALSENTGAYLKPAQVVAQWMPFSRDDLWLQHLLTDVISTLRAAARLEILRRQPVGHQADKARDDFRKVSAAYDAIEDYLRTYGQSFFGTYRISMDQKGRIKIPAVFNLLNQNVYLKETPAGIDIYPSSYVDIRRLSASSSRYPIRFEGYSELKGIRVDQGNRITIDVELRNKFLKGETKVVLISARSHLTLVAVRDFKHESLPILVDPIQQELTDAFTGRATYKLEKKRINAPELGKISGYQGRTMVPISNGFEKMIILETDSVHGTGRLYRVEDWERRVAASRPLGKSEAEWFDRMVFGNAFPVEVDSLSRILFDQAMFDAMGWPATTKAITVEGHGTYFKILPVVEEPRVYQHSIRWFANLVRRLYISHHQKKLEQFGSLSAADFAKVEYGADIFLAEHMDRFQEIIRASILGTLIGAFWLTGYVQGWITPVKLFEWTFVSNTIQAFLFAAVHTGPDMLSGFQNRFAAGFRYGLLIMYVPIIGFREAIRLHRWNNWNYLTRLGIRTADLMPRGNPRPWFGRKLAVGKNFFGDVSRHRPGSIKVVHDVLAAA